MTANQLQARDEILAKFRTAWLADATSQDIPILFWDTEGNVPDSGAYTRVSVRHVIGGQATLSNAVGSRRFRHEGNVFVQIFTPHNEGGTLSDELAMIAKNAFEGEVTSPGRVIFRNVRLNEIGQEGQWFQINVLADFEYDEIR